MAFAIFVQTITQKFECINVVHTAAKVDGQHSSEKSLCVQCTTSQTLKQPNDGVALKSQLLSNYSWSVCFHKESCE